MNAIQWNDFLHKKKKKKRDEKKKIISIQKLADSFWYICTYVCINATPRIVD